MTIPKAEIVVGDKRLVRWCLREGYITFATSSAFVRRADILRESSLGHLELVILLVILGLGIPCSEVQFHATTKEL